MNNIMPSHYTAQNHKIILYLVENMRKNYIIILYQIVILTNALGKYSTYVLFWPNLKDKHNT